MEYFQLISMQTHILLSDNSQYTLSYSSLTLYQSAFAPTAASHPSSTHKASIIDRVNEVLEKRLFCLHKF